MLKPICDLLLEYLKKHTKSKKDKAFLELLKHITNPGDLPEVPLE